MHLASHAKEGGTTCCAVEKRFAAVGKNRVRCSWRREACTPRVWRRGAAGSNTASGLGEPEHRERLEPRESSRRPFCGLQRVAKLLRWSEDRPKSVGSRSPLFGLWLHNLPLHDNCQVTAKCAISAPGASPLRSYFTLSAVKKKNVRRKSVIAEAEKDLPSGGPSAPGRRVGAQAARAKSRA